MEHLLAALRAVAEPTRLRLVILCARGELTVSELTQILGQSQPRVSRHLKLLCEAGLLDRFREGSWVFYRLSRSSPAGVLARQLVAACGETDATIALDLQRLGAIKRQRSDLASALVHLTNEDPEVRAGAVRDLRAIGGSRPTRR